MQPTTSSTHVGGLFLRPLPTSQTMTHNSQSLNSQVRWLLRASAIVLVCLPAVAQEYHLSPPLTAYDVMERVVAMNEVRAKALATYSSLRSYHLECHCLTHKKADM